MTVLITDFYFLLTLLITVNKNHIFVNVAFINVICIVAISRAYISIVIVPLNHLRT